MRRGPQFARGLLSRNYCATAASASITRADIHQLSRGTGTRKRRDAETRRLELSPRASLHQLRPVSRPGIPGIRQDGATREYVAGLSPGRPAGKTNAAHRRREPRGECAATGRRSARGPCEPRTGRFPRSWRELNLKVHADIERDG